jgi:hypothetical protein
MFLKSYIQMKWMVGPSMIKYAKNVVLRKLIKKKISFNIHI